MKTELATIASQYADAVLEIAVKDGNDTLAGAPVNASAIPIADDGRTHIVVVVLGDLKTGRQRARSQAAPRAGAVFHPEHLR